MQLLTAPQFLSWLAARNIGVDKHYEPPQCLVFQSGQSNSRFWTVPPEPAAVPGFFAHALKGTNDWETCYLWARGRRWPISHGDDAPGLQVKCDVPDETFKRPKWMKHEQD